MAPARMMTRIQPPTVLQPVGAFTSVSGSSGTQGLGGDVQVGGTGDGIARSKETCWRFSRLGEGRASAGDDGDGDDDGGDLIAVMQELRSQCIDYGIKCANWDS